MSVRIKLLRRQHGLSLEQLAQRSGLTKSYLSKVERGLCTPSISSALKLAQALAVDVALLFGSPTDDSQLCITRAGDALRVSSAEPAGRVIELLASQICGEPLPVERDLAEACDPARFGTVSPCNGSAQSLSLFAGI